MKTKLFISVALLAIASSLCSSANPALDSTRTALDKWVETRQIISKETSDWKVEKSILQDTEGLLEAEIERLDKELALLNDTSTSADEERAKLTETRDNLSAATKVVVDEVITLEKQVKQILPTLPKPLLKKIKPLVTRLPDNPEETELSMGQRVQNIVGILSQADKFNTTITAESESRELDSGKIVEVTTLYWGLAIAYYVDASGDYAGIGHPTTSSWEWPKIDGAGPQIRELLNIYEGSGDIQFIEIPARIN